jgi:hypothetical protein
MDLNFKGMIVKQVIIGGRSKVEKGIFVLNGYYRTSFFGH